jgi:thiol reductant ABC exporter CydD subunit
VSDARVRPFDPRLLRRAATARRLLAIDVAAGLAGTLLLLGQVSLVAAVLAAVVEGEADAVPPALVAALAAAIVGRAAMAWLVEVSGRRAAAGVMSSLRTELVARRLRLGGGDLATGSSSELATAAVQGVDGLETYFARYLPQVVLVVVVPVAVLAVTAAVDLTSAAIVAITLPVVPVFMALIGRAAAHRSRQRWAALTVLGAHFLDVVRGLPTLRAFNRGRAQIPKLAEAADAYRRTTMGTLRLSFLSGAVLDLAATLSTALVAVTLGVRLIGGQVALRPALTVLLLVPELYAPLRQLGSMFHASADGLASATRILEVVESGEPTPTAVSTTVCAGGPGPSSAPARALPDPAHAIVRLRGVSVRFPGRPVPALDDVDLAIAPGELLAVTGPSGAGKSTLGQVLLGVRVPDEGAVLVGGRALAASDLDGWRHHLAWAPQHPVLVHASVAVNIALGRPDTTRDVIEAAAQAAGAHAFVAALPGGYDTVLGSGGRTLSPGQRQRLGLARALLRDASLLVLDEPTAHLDAASVDHVARTLDHLRGQATMVVITHDPRLVEVAHRRVVMRGGRLASPVAHDETGGLVTAEAAT